MVAMVTFYYYFYNDRQKF